MHVDGFPQCTGHVAQEETSLQPLQLATCKNVCVMFAGKITTLTARTAGSLSPDGAAGGINIPQLLRLLLPQVRERGIKHASSLRQCLLVLFAFSSGDERVVHRLCVPDERERARSCRRRRHLAAARIRVYSYMVTVLSAPNKCAEHQPSH
eukprot:6176268-Pleurochrysis_carterae.AAC.1